VSSTTEARMCSARSSCLPASLATGNLSNRAWKRCRVQLGMKAA
jgi:hypothetical protein